MRGLRYNPTMRPSPPLTVLVLLAVAVAGLIAFRPDEPQVAPTLPPGGDPLIALPFDPLRTVVAAPMAFELPAQWVASDAGWRLPNGQLVLRPLAFSDDPELALTTRLKLDCAWPVVLRWREQWRGECRSRRGTRIRAAVLRENGEWHGVEARYPDSLDAQLAPRVSRVLGSLRRAR